MLIVAVGVAFAVALFAIVSLRRGADAAARAEAEEAFAAAMAGENSVVGRLMLRGGRMLSGSPHTMLDPESAAYRNLRTRLNAAGNPYAGSPMVYLSTQIAAGLLAVMILIVLFFSSSGGMGMAAGAMVAFGIAYWPWQRITVEAKKRADLIDKDLPDFAELLLMPLSGGYGILPALGFTADRSSGPVADEVETLLRVVTTGQGNEAEAFLEAGDRLGTPAARAFFASLGQAYLEGTAVVESLRGQADQLRKLSYERTREKIKVLPNKLVLIMGVHLMPGLFLVVLLPVLTQWSDGLHG